MAEGKVLCFLFFGLPFLFQLLVFLVDRAGKGEKPLLKALGHVKDLYKTITGFVGNRTLSCLCFSCENRVCFTGDATSQIKKLFKQTHFHNKGVF